MISRSRWVQTSVSDLSCSQLIARAQRPTILSPYKAPQAQVIQPRSSNRAFSCTASAFFSSPAEQDITHRQPRPKPRSATHKKPLDPEIALKGALEVDVLSRWSDLVSARIFFNSEGLHLWPRPRHALSYPVRTYTTQDLRFRCSCPKCIDTFSGQRKLSLGDIPTGGVVTDVLPRKNGLAIFISSPEGSEAEAHEVHLPWDDLRLKVRSQKEAPRLDEDLRTHALHWDAEVLQRNIRRISFKDFMALEGGNKTEKGLIQAVGDLCRLGIVIISDVPKEETSVNEITTRIAPIMKTFYGLTFDVKVKPDAENVAYTNDYLAPHQDLLYLDSPPKIQLLHCMENECEGGESLFVDAHRVAESLLLRPRSLGPTSGFGFETLEDKVTYEYSKNPHRHRQSRPILEVTANKTLKDVWWSPPFIARQSTLSSTWMKWARLVENLFSQEQSVYQYKLQPGECVLFDNRRVLHGRRAFVVDGRRWLRGAYISLDDFNARAWDLMPRYSYRLPEGDEKKFMWHKRRDWLREVREEMKALALQDTPAEERALLAKLWTR